MKMIYSVLHYFLIVFLRFSFISGHGHRAHNTIMRFTYGDSNPEGPPKWGAISDAPSTVNYCRQRGPDHVLKTPLNIVTSQATLPIRDIEEEFKFDIKKPSLTFNIQDEIEKIEWLFGYPPDIYHGLQMTGPRLGLFQVLDLYHDSTGKQLAYDFNFATITFCKLNAVNKDRSSHQLNGKRYPFEVNMVFFSQPRKIGIDHNLPPNSNTTLAIMISVLGEIGSKDNELLAPLLKAASEYRGGDFENDDRDPHYVVKIKPPFSPTWLLPKKSQYYYYEHGSFPVPPCFPLSQVYVLKSVIKISQAQLNILTGVYAERELEKKFTCTFGVLKHDVGSTPIFYNPYPLTFIGSDNRPGEKKPASHSPPVRLAPLILKCLIYFNFILINFK